MGKDNYLNNGKEIMIDPCYVNCQDACEESCRSTCEKSCQSTCQKSCQCSYEGCQTTCESICQCSTEGCQEECQSSCQCNEENNQSGGGNSRLLISDINATSITVKISNLQYEANLYDKLIQPMK